MAELCSAAGPVGEAVGRAEAHEVLRCGLGSEKGGFFDRVHVLVVVERVHSGEIHVSAGWGEED